MTNLDLYDIMIKNIKEQARMKYPDHLNKKGTIGFVAPSFGCAISPYREGFP